MDASYLDLLMAQQQQIARAEAEGGGVWVVANAKRGAVAPVTLEALGAARELADVLGAYVFVVLLGDGVSDLASLLYQAGADDVRVADHPVLARAALETRLKVLSDLFHDEQPEVVLFGASNDGQQLAARLAQALGGGLIEHAVALSLDESERVVRASVPVYGGEYLETFVCPLARPQIVTIESGAFPAPLTEVHRKGEPRFIVVEPVDPAVRVVGPAESFAPPDVSLARAPVIVAAGRQAGDFEQVRRLAQALGAQVAGDRGARDMGWIESGQIIDVRGVTVAPRLYIAVGICGDAFHNAAVEGARFIVAIHPDSNAPVFQIADLCLEADPRCILPTLIEALGWLE